MTTPVQQAIETLRAEFGTSLTTTAAVREQHGRGEAYAQGFAPDAVIWPESTGEVSTIVRTCHDLRVPVIAYGAGTSLEGHVSAPHGGICIDLSRMDLILAVHAEDADCVVQPGVTREALNTFLRDTGLFFPVDPGANATLGGMISTRASGTTTVRYGTIAQNVLALEIVLANGDIVRCGSRARKSSAGYDLVRLMTGAEGTLGIITEATLRLHGQPEAIGSAVCSFGNLRGAVEAVIELIQSGAPLARIEFLDEVQVRACNAYSKMSLREEPTLFIEFHGTENGVREQFERASEVVRSHGDIGKRVTAKYYENAAQRSYFFGCSEGGREALIEAQRFPQDFDGIVAGAPAHYWTDLLTGFVRAGQALHKDPASFIPPAKLPIIQQAALAACDVGDGVKDGIVSAPQKCKFDPQVLACKSGSDESQCLTAAQVTGLQELYELGYVPSGENEVSAMGGGLRQYAFGAAPGQSFQVMFANGFFGGFVFEKADWDYRTFDFTRDAAMARDKLGALLNASKTDLSEFDRRGGKLIQYHGLLDGSIPPAMSTTYFDRVAKQSGGVGKTQDFYRLFLAPGVLHCGFGPGPNAFGNLGPRPPADAEHDTLLALQKWVEEGVAPKQIVATKYVDDDRAKGVSMTRPLCPYPQSAQWDGKGKVEASESFSCK